MLLITPISWVVVVWTAVTTAAPTRASNVLTPQNFKQTVSQGVWFVEHFSPYCPHCRHFEPTWNEVADHFESMPDPGVHLAQVNCALNGDLCNGNGVTGYPQMNLYRNGQFVESFNQDREFHILVEYLKKHAEPEGKAAPSMEQEFEPTPTPSPAAERLVIQTPRTDANPSGTVVSLNVQNFDGFLAQGPVFIKFFAPWCAHCKKLAPTWTQLGRRMEHKLNIAEVDCEEHKALCTSQGVTGFPMMFFYAHGTKTEYAGGRSYDQLVSFADRASSPTMQSIDALGLDQIVHDSAVLYLLLHDESDSRLVNDVSKLAQALLGSPLVYVSTSPELFSKYHLSPGTSSALLAFKDKSAREPVAVFNPSSSSSSSGVAALSAWMYTNRFPTSMELSKDVFQQVMYAPHKPLVVVVATPEGQQAAVSDKLDEIGTKWRLRTRAHGTGAGTREVVFTWMDAGQWGKWMKDMYGVKLRGEPVVVVADHDRLVYYDKDAAGHAIALNSVSVASALEAIVGGTARAKHSRNVLERAVHGFNGMIAQVEAAIIAHPYMTVLALLGLVAVVVIALQSLVKDDPEDWVAGKRYAKGDRLD